MNPKALIGVALVAGLAAGAVALYGGGSHGGPSPARAEVSRWGAQVKVSPRVITLPARNGTRLAAEPQAWLMSTASDGWEFYRLEPNGSSLCFGLGRVVEGAHKLLAMACSEKFPTRAPVLDLSVVGADSPSKPFHVMTLRGFAADAVASVEAVDEAGKTVAQAWVRNNVYSLDVPPDVGGRAIVARDAAGGVLYRSG